MKFIFAILAITVAVAQAGEFFNEDELNNHFEMFKSQYRRFYLNTEEEIFRKQTFAANLDFIFRHNLDFFAGRKTFNVAVNNFTDMSNAEFRGRFNGLRLGAKHQSAPSVHFQEHVHALPDTVDWTTKGVVTPIKDQAQCGSCWAFSAVASMEGQHALKTGKLVSLSEQNLVDCSSAEGNDGCGGGLMDQAFQYVIANKGIDTEASYAYKAVDESCEFNAKNVGTTISSYTDVKTGSEDALQNAVATIGPISVGIDASQLSFQFYSGGVYNEPECSSVDLDHGVTAVGYGTQSGQAYWKVKNSWGSDWGLQGYILMSRNVNNQCGIATAASYPVV